jgi:type VI protein secretion system component VasF
VIRVLACMSLFALLPGAYAESPTHEHAVPAQTAPADAVVPQRHASDAPLRAGMGAIRQLLMATPKDSAAAQLAALADGIEAEVQGIFRECRLQPAADAALHGILATLLQAVADLRQPPVPASTWTDLDQALHSYQQQFDDPGFAQEQIHTDSPALKPRQ